MDSLAYKRWFDGRRSSLRLPTDCSETEEPAFVFYTQYALELKWRLEFTSRHYIRVWEQRGRIKGLDESHRSRFAYHYGPVCHAGDVYMPDDPVVIRIDNCNSTVHLHYLEPQSHIAQADVRGLKLENVDPFSFIKAVFRHRKTGKPLNEVMGFRVG